MSSPFKPVPGTFRILETDSYRQLALPIAQREIKAGDALWLNAQPVTTPTTSWVEPALNSPSGYASSNYSSVNPVISSITPASVASTSASAAAERAAFAALFIGIAQAHRTPRSFNKYLNFAVPASSSVQYDSSAPFMTVVTSGIADVPYLDDSGNNNVQAAVPVGTGVSLSAFLNASTFFVDASGIPVTATKYYLYNNSVMFNNTAAAIIGRLVKNAKVGDVTVRIEFSCELSVAASGQVAGELID